MPVMGETCNREISRSKKGSAAVPPANPVGRGNTDESLNFPGVRVLEGESMKARTLKMLAWALFFFGLFSGGSEAPLF